jgi:argininosuccinate synthase
MTVLRLAHLDIEGLVLDSQVRSLRDQFVTHKWSELLYNGTLMDTPSSNHFS